MIFPADPPTERIRVIMRSLCYRNHLSMESISVQQPPRTIREVFESLPEGTLAQLIENQLVMSPSPSDRHQEVLHEISVIIYNYLKQHSIGKVRIAPYDVHLDDENIFQPDLIFIRNENLSNIQQNGYHGAPDLVLEVLSPRTARYDRGKKKTAYERHGVSEYWLVDPDTREAEGFFLKEGRYGDPVRSNGRIESEILGNIFEFN